MIDISSSFLEVAIDAVGAQLSAVRDRYRRNYLWHGDPGLWAGRAPILFPIVGALNGGKYRHQGVEYSLPRHGFARGSAFDLVDRSEAAATFRLRSSEATLATYPFEFVLEMRYAIAGPTLTMTATIRNAGASRMPASFGFHPGLLWPLPGQSRSGHFIEFEHDEPAPIRRLDAQGLLSPQAHPTPIAKRRLALDDALFKDDVLILDTFSSRRLVYGAHDGPQIELGFPEARYLGLWTRPGAPFLCIEPWQGIADPAGFAGDLLDKPGIFIVEPGEQHAFAMTLSLRD